MNEPIRVRSIIALSENVLIRRDQIGVAWKHRFLSQSRLFSTAITVALIMSLLCSFLRKQMTHKFSTAALLRAYIPYRFFRHCVYFFLWCCNSIKCFAFLLFAHDLWSFYRLFYRIQRFYIVFDAFVSEYRFFRHKKRNYGARPWPLFCSG